MSFNDHDASGINPSHLVNFDSLHELSNTSALIPSLKQGPRARRRAMRLRQVGKAGILAPLLAAQGCLSLGKRDVDISGGNTDGEGDLLTGANLTGGGAIPGSNTGTPFADGGAPASTFTNTPIEAQNDQFHLGDGAHLEVSTSELLANDFQGSTASLELVQVFNAQHGTVTLNGGTVMFMPDHGFTGGAQFSYVVRDASGTLSEAVVNVHVGGEDHHTAGSHGGHGSGGHVHPDDPSKASEHHALLNLVPVADATHIAVNNGSWFDPNTWANGEVPPDGAAVVIPEGVTVAYDGESAASLFTVRVDGGLEFATDQDTFMEVDTLIVAPTGKLTIGSVDQPVAHGGRGSYSNC